MLLRRTKLLLGKVSIDALSLLELLLHCHHSVNAIDKNLHQLNLGTNWELQ